MILTITPPSEPSSFDYALRRKSCNTHDLSPTSRPRSTRPFDASSLSSFKVSSHHFHLFSRDAPGDMTTHHRGLPPPAAMALPDPTRPAASMHPSTSSSYPPQSHFSDEPQTAYLSVRAEEEKSRQEEERRKQEELKLRQREIEHQMLRDSLHGGIPPQLVPVIFAGISGGPLASSALDFAQQALSQFLHQAQQPPPPQQQQQQPQHQVLPTRPPSPGRKDIAFQPPYLPTQPLPQQPIVSGQAVHPNQVQHTSAYPSPAYASPSNQSRPLYAAHQQHQQQYSGPTSAPRNTAQTLSSLPRLTTNEPTPVSYGPPSQAQQLQQQHENQASPSPSLYFHHWQPPAASGANSKDNKDGKDGKESQKTSPKSIGQASSQEQASPRKRKAQGAHTAAPPPSKSSPTFSTVSTTSNKSKRLSGNGRRGSVDSVVRAYDPIGRDNRRNKREGSSSQEDRSQRGTPKPAE